MDRQTDRRTAQSLEIWAVLLFFILPNRPTPRPTQEQCIHFLKILDSDDDNDDETEPDYIADEYDPDYPLDIRGGNRPTQVGISDDFDRDNLVAKFKHECMIRLYYAPYHRTSYGYDSIKRSKYYRRGRTVKSVRNGKGTWQIWRYVLILL